MVVTADGRVALRDGGAARLATDLTEPGWDPSRPPPAVAGAVARLYAAEIRAQPGDDVALEGMVRAQGRSGRWYEITASRADTDADSAGRSIIVIAPVRAEGLLRILSRLYGLTPREREVLQRVARGHSTKAIARDLKLSPYTVQEHIGNASEKVGVRGRRELVGRLFLDGMNVS
jgi:DNA-binding CsgD family transcriptional regulator